MLKQFTLVLTIATAFVCGKSSKPGQCDSKNNPCSTGDCVSVENNIVGLEKVSQCTIGDICSGNAPGNCPTFSSWPTNYQKLESVCAFVDPGNCARFGDTASETDQTVDCFNMTIQVDVNTTFEEFGIYKCVSNELFQESDFPDDFLSDAAEACAGETSESPLCNGQGTCAAKSSLSAEYTCKCNLGFSSDDNCLKATSNACNNLGQCGEGGECNTSTNECDCDDGITGNQCSMCESDASCNQGKCGTDGICTCDTGFKGAFCEKVDASASDGTKLATSFIFLLYIFFT